jgi:glycosyl transferase family 87
VVVCAALAMPGAALVPGGVEGGPDWLLGPFGDGLGLEGGAYLALMAGAFFLYLAVLATAGSIPGRWLAAGIVVAVTLLALAPPLLSQDVFSYIASARLGVNHNLDPYANVPAQAPTDPVYAHVGWTHSVSAYGPVFTLGTYSLAKFSVPVALWILKAAAALAVLALAWLVARLAALRGVEPRAAAAFVALNPLVLVHVVGGAHNDGVMMVLVAAGALAVLAGREALAGGALVAAAAVKVSAGFALPFALIGAARRGWFAAGAIAAAVVAGLLSLIFFGTDAFESIGLAGENQALTSRYSIPATLSRILGVDVDPVRITALVLYGALVVWLAAWAWRGGDWLRAAGWAAFGLLMATGWLLPWYLIWALPLAALARDRALAVAVLALTAFQLVNRVPL